MTDIILPNMGLIQFQVNGDNNTWGGGINNNSATIDSHNHTDGLGRRVPSAGININDDLSFGTLFAPVNLNRVQFDAIVAITDGAQNQSIFVNVADSELYWRTALGNNIQLTAGNSLNVSAFVGGIVGDYTAVGAEVAFVDADKAYTFKDGDSKRARVDAGGIKLIAFGTTNTIGVTLAARSDISFSYTATWPNALPVAAGTLVQIDNTGQVSFANTGINGLTLASNTSATVSGTGDYHHGSLNLQICAQSGTALEAHWVNDPSGTTFGKNSTGNGFLTVPIPLQSGKRVTGARFLLSGNGVADVDVTLRMTDSSGVPTNLATLTVTNQGALEIKTMTVTPRTLSVDESCFMTFLSSASGLHLDNITITYDYL